MRKRLAILAIAVCGAVCVSGQPNNAADDKQQPANQVQSTVAATVSPERQNIDKTDKAKADTDPPKWYTPLEKPDWWLVGIAFVTGCFICWQSWETRKSADAALLNAQAANVQIQMMKDKERARLRIELQELDLTRMPRMGNLSIQYKVILSGSTQAAILSSACRAGVVLRDEFPGPGELFPKMIIPSVITPTMGEVESMAMVLLSDDLNLAFKFSDELIQSIKDSERRVFCEGYVRYKDVFGECWVFNFKQIWAYCAEPLPADPVWQGGYWENYGDETENGEFKADQPISN